MRKFKRSIKRRRHLHRATCLAFVVGTAGHAQAQQVIMPLPSLAPTTSASIFGNFGDENNVLPSDISLFKIGPVNLRPHLSYRYLYAEGLQSAPGQSANSVVQSFSPGILLTLGPRWNLDYTPTLTFYSSKQFKDSLDQTFSLSGSASYEDWTFGINQTYAVASDPLVETATQTDTESYTTSLTASYRFNSEFSTDITLSQSYSAADNFVGSFSWSLTDYLNYQFYSRFDGGIGLILGYDDVSAGSDMSHEQIQARLNWRPSSKLSLSIHGGVEDRQYLGAMTGDTITPVFGVAISDQIFRNTSLSLTADRAISPSLFQSQASESTSVSFIVSQQLFTKFTLTGNASYQLTEYITSGAIVPVNTGSGTVVVSSSGRSDSSYSLGATLSWSFFKRATASLSYGYSKDNSNDAGFGYASSQIGATLNYTF